MNLDQVFNPSDSGALPPSPSMTIEMGRVGWFPDNDSDIADVSDAELGGRTLVKVTLVRGAHPDDVPPEGEVRGMQIRARVLGPVYYVPPKGTEVLVAFPGGFEQTPGAAVILGTLGATPSSQFSTERLKFDVGDDADILIRGRRVTLTAPSPTGGATEPFISITPEDGISCCDHEGFGYVIKDHAVTIFAPDPADGDAKTVVRLSKDDLRLMNKDSGGNVCSLTLKDKELCAAGLVFNTCAPGTNLGSAATAATPALTGVGTAAAVGVWIAALTVWVTNVQNALNGLGVPIAPPLPPMPVLASSAVNIQP